VPAADLDPRRPTAELGLSSLLILELRGWFETTLELTLPITVLWDFTTVRDLSRELLRRVRAGDGGTVGGAFGSRTVARIGEPAGTTSEDDELQRIVDDVRGLSDEEVARQLDELSRTKA
jgi:acyl carrier protein